MKQSLFLDLIAFYHESKDKLDAGYRRVMETGWYTLDPEMEAFKQEFADYWGVSSTASAWETAWMPFN